MGEDSVSAQASGRELPLTSCGHKTNTVAGRLELAQPGEPQNNWYNSSGYSSAE
jgi:hypothetical protein